MGLNNMGKSHNFLGDPDYREIKHSLDNTMRKGTNMGLGLNTRQADIISTEQEEHLWSKAILGDGDPRTLVDTMLFLIGLNFALRSGDEHRSLTIDQLEVKNTNQGECLHYKEKNSKNNQGGLLSTKVAAKSVSAYGGPVVDRSIVRLYRKYMSHRPHNAPDAFYLRPLSQPRGDVWFYASPIGKDNLANTIKRMCKSAGFTGFYTNHSLRATCATRLFQQGVDEQLIARTTGHRSNAVRQYKRVSDDQDLMISNVIQGGSKRQCTSESRGASATVTSADVNRSVEVTVKVNLV